MEVNHVPDPDTTTTKKYYSFAGMMVAMEKVVGENKALYYFASDHLSSSSVVMNNSGGLESENRYMPFGEVRDITGTDDPITQTDFGYTGQRNIADIGLSTTSSSNDRGSTFTNSASWTNIVTGPNTGGRSTFFLRASNNSCSVRKYSPRLTKGKPRSPIIL